MYLQENFDFVEKIWPNVVKMCGELNVKMGSVAVKAFSTGNSEIIKFFIDNFPLKLYGYYLFSKEHCLFYRLCEQGNTTLANFILDCIIKSVNKFDNVETSIRTLYFPILMLYCAQGELDEQKKHYLMEEVTIRAEIKYHLQKLLNIAIHNEKMEIIEWIIDNVETDISFDIMLRVCTCEHGKQKSKLRTWLNKKYQQYYFYCDLLGQITFRPRMASDNVICF